MIYFIFNNYTPNTAATNRILGYLEIFEKENIPVKVIYILPGLHDEVMNSHFKNIQVKYQWRHLPHKNKICKGIIFFWSLYVIRKKIKKGDIVYTYGINAIMERLLGKKGVRYYAERTEHLEVTEKEPWPLGVSKNKCIEICKKLDGLFVISSPLRDFFVRFGIEGKKVHIINMIVDANRFANIDKKNVRERYIAYCGTASNNKDGVNELIKAFGIVCNTLEDVKLYIIGKTPSIADKESNLLLIEKLGLSDKVVFTGIVPANEMPQLLKNAEVLALDRPNSLQAEYGFPTKLGEYLLTGNPVVVTKVGDIPKYLEDGISALLSEERNEKDFSEKLIWALTHSKEAAVIGENGKKVALKMFNSEIETRKIISIFQS